MIPLGHANTETPQGLQENVAGAVCCRSLGNIGRPQSGQSVGDGRLGAASAHSIASPRAITVRAIPKSVHEFILFKSDHLAAWLSR